MIFPVILEKGNLEKIPYILGNGTPPPSPPNIFFQETKLSYISGRTSKSPKTKISFISPEKVMNKFF